MRNKITLLNKPVIENVKISDKELEELKASLKRGIKKSALIRKYAGGVCTYCGEIPIKKVSYDVDKGKLVDFYCDPCFERWICK